jgi:hypothetical protein
MEEKPNTPFARYLDEVAAQLEYLPVEIREQLLAELHTHLEDAATTAQLSPDSIELQYQVIKTLGPAQVLGRSLVQAHQPAFTWLDRLLNITGGLAIALQLIILMVGTVFATSMTGDEDAAEGLFIGTLLFVPALALPAMLALARMYRGAAPGLTRVMVVCGYCSLVLPLVLVALQVFLPYTQYAASLYTQASWLAVAQYASLVTAFVGSGITMLLAAFIGARTRILPGDGHLSLAGVVGGIGWLLLFSGLTALSLNATSSGNTAWIIPIWGGFMLVVIGQGIWSIWLSGWLLLRGVRR